MGPVVLTHVWLDNKQPCFDLIYFWLSINTYDILLVRDLLVVCLLMIKTTESSSITVTSKPPAALSRGRSIGSNYVTPSSPTWLWSLYKTIPYLIPNTRLCRRLSCEVKLCTCPLDTNNTISHLKEIAFGRDHIQRFLGHSKEGPIRIL